MRRISPLSRLFRSTSAALHLFLAGFRRFPGHKWDTPEEASCRKNLNLCSARTENVLAPNWHLGLVNVSQSHGEVLGRSRYPNKGVFP